MRRTARWILPAVVVVAVVILFVLPARTLLHQRTTLARTRQQLQVLDTEDAKLSATATSLRSTAEIERIARSRYGLVMPGQHAYVVLPPASGVPAGSAQTTSPSTSVPGD